MEAASHNDPKFPGSSAPQRPPQDIPPCVIAGAPGSYRSLNLPFKGAMAVLGVLMIASWSVPTAFYVAKQRTAYHRLSDDARLEGFLEREEYHPRTAGLIGRRRAANRRWSLEHGHLGRKAA